MYFTIKFQASQNHKLDFSSEIFNKISLGIVWQLELCGSWFLNPHGFDEKMYFLEIRHYLNFWGHITMKPPCCQMLS